ncbi:MAG: STAS domain-containing protein [Bacteroidota bacterium]
MIEIKQSERNTPRVLTLNGKLTLMTQDKLWRAVQHIIVEKGDRQLVLEFSEVAECDSYGISELLRLHRSIHNIGGRMVITGLNALLRRVFSITKVDTIFEIAPSLPEAIASFPGSDLKPATT